MNEITTITADWSEAEQKFAKILVGTLTRKLKELGDPPVPLADITVCPDDFKRAFHLIKGIDRHGDWKSTVEYMLRLLWERDELVVYPLRSTYTLSKSGKLYKHLRTNLARTL